MTSVVSVSFLSFLAVISVSLGVLNLLPIPMLDGGHLFYYLIERDDTVRVGNELEGQLVSLGDGQGQRADLAQPRDLGRARHLREAHRLQHRDPVLRKRKIAIKM